MEFSMPPNWEEIDQAQLQIARFEASGDINRLQDLMATLSQTEAECRRNSFDRERRTMHELFQLASKSAIAISSPTGTRL